MLAPGQNANKRHRRLTLGTRAASAKLTRSRNNTVIGGEKTTQGSRKISRESSQFLLRSASKMLKKKGSVFVLDPKTEQAIPIEPSPTGIHDWTFLLDPITAKPFFRNTKTNKSRWGLPLRDLFIENKAPASYMRDDWQCYVDPRTFRRYYKSKRAKRIQYSPPKQYKKFLEELPFFSEEYAQKSLETYRESGVELPEIVKETNIIELMRIISLEDILENNLTCAAFHRFLIATYAEENLLFLGALEIYSKGSWKGMKALGQKVTGEDIDEGIIMLQKQLETSKAMALAGFEHNEKTQLEEALLVYNRFLAPESDMWVCVMDKTSQKVKATLDCADETTNLKDLFNEAREEVFLNMSKELLKRFVRAAMGDVKEKGFESDPVLQQTIKYIAELKQNAGN